MKGSKLLIMFGVILGIATIISSPKDTGFVDSDRLSFAEIQDDLSVYSIDVDVPDGVNKIKSNYGESVGFGVSFDGSYPVHFSPDNRNGLDRRVSKEGRSPPSAYKASLSITNPLTEKVKRNPRYGLSYCLVG